MTLGEKEKQNLCQVLVQRLSCVFGSCSSEKFKAGLKTINHTEESKWKLYCPVSKSIVTLGFCQQKTIYVLQHLTLCDRRPVLRLQKELTVTGSLFGKSLYHISLLRPWYDRVTSFKEFFSLAVFSSHQVTMLIQFQSWLSDKAVTKVKGITSGALRFCYAQFVFFYGLQLPFSFRL